MLETSPPAIVLDFDEEIEARSPTSSCSTASGTPIDVGAAAGRAPTPPIVTATVPALDDGIYAVIWRVTSADGHVVDGAFSFQVGTAAAGDGKDLIDQVSRGAGADPALDVDATASPGSSRSPVPSLLLGWGCGSLQGRPRLGQRPAHRRCCGSAGCRCSSARSVRSACSARRSSGGSVGDAFRPSAWGDIAGTDTGRACCCASRWRVVLGSACWPCGTSSDAHLVAWRRRRRRRSSRWSRSPSRVTPTRSSPRLLWITVDVLHLAAITVWVGGLLALLVGRQGVDGRARGRAARRAVLARRPLIAVPIIVATGVAQTLKLAGGLDDVTATTGGACCSPR